MRRYPTEIDVLAVYKTQSKLPRGVWDEFLTLPDLRWYLFSVQLLPTHSTGQIFLFTVVEAKFVKKIACVRGAYQHLKGEGAKSEDGETFWAKLVSVYQHGMGAAFLAKKAAKLQHREHAV